MVKLINFSKRIGMLDEEARYIERGVGEESRGKRKRG
jgi:hypothetical protein